mgnify:CR=1 FL=1
MKKTSQITVNGMIAAMYTVLTVLPLLIPSVGQFLYGTIQFRISELLCILPFFMPSSAWGLFVGCAVSNYIGVSFGFTQPVDIVVGSLATLAAAWIAGRIRHKWLVPLPTILANGIIVGLMLTVLYPLGDMPFGLNALLFGAQVALGEAVVCYALGMPLLLLLEKKGFRKQKMLESIRR